MRLALLLLLLSACPAKPSPPASMDRTERALAAVKRYRAEVLFVAPDSLALVGATTPANTAPVRMEARTRIDVVRPNKMRMRTETSSGEGNASGLIMDIAWDGRWQVMHTRFANPPSPAFENQPALKIEQTLAPIERPYDTGYNTRGLGLLPGHDLVSTLEQLIRCYRWRDEGDGVLVGTAERGKLIDALLAEGQLAGLIESDAQLPFVAGALGAMIGGMEYAKVTIGQDGWPRRLDFGWSKDEPAWWLEIVELELEPEIPDSTFRPDFAATAQDLTPAMREQRAKWTAALTSSAAREATLSRLRAGIERASRRARP